MGQLKLDLSFSKVCRSLITLVMNLIVYFVKLQLRKLFVCRATATIHLIHWRELLQGFHVGKRFSGLAEFCSSVNNEDISVVSAAKRQLWWLDSIYDKATEINGAVKCGSTSPNIAILPAIDRQSNIDHRQNNIAESDDFLNGTYRKSLSGFSERQSYKAGKRGSLCLLQRQIII